jgi:hypothetical protein
MAQNINELINDPNFSKLLEQAYEDLPAQLGFPGWKVGNLNWVTQKELQDFIESIGGQDHIKWLTGSVRDGKIRGQILVSPEGMKNASLSS